MDWPPDQYQHQYESAPLHAIAGRRRGINWQAVFAALVVLIILLGLTIWRLNRGDSTDATRHDPDPDSTAAPVDSDSGDAGHAGSPASDYQTVGTEAADRAPPSSPIVTPEHTADSSAAAIPTSTISVPADADEFGPPTLSTRSTVSTVGLDSVTFGMTVQQAQESSGTLLVPTGPVSQCYHVIPRNAPEGIVFLVYAGTIERVDIVNGPITTRSGVGIGTRDETVISLFGDSIERSARSDGTVDLIFVPRDAGDANFRVVFNVADGVVRSYKSGRIPQVLGDTGCETPTPG